MFPETKAFMGWHWKQNVHTDMKSVGHLRHKSVAIKVTATAAYQINAIETTDMYAILSYRINIVSIKANIKAATLKIKY